MIAYVQAYALAASGITVSLSEEKLALALALARKPEAAAVVLKRLID